MGMKEIITVKVPTVQVGDILCGTAWTSPYPHARMTGSRPASRWSRWPSTRSEDRTTPGGWSLTA